MHNKSPRQDCWRLVHDGKKVLALFRSTGVTETIYTLVCGTEKECRDEIAKLKLRLDPKLDPAQRQKDRAARLTLDSAKREEIRKR